MNGKPTRNNVIDELTIVFSIAVVVILALRPLTIKRFGANQAYHFWLAVPCCLIVSLLPDQTKIPVAFSATDFNVLPSETSTNVTQVNFGSYLLAAYFVGLTIFTLVFLISFIRYHRLQKTLLLPRYHSIDGLSELPIYLNPKISSPMLMGLFTPTIHLPTDFDTRFNSFQQSAIIQHELHHYRRKDIFWNLVAHVIVVMFWFNPLTWVGYRSFRQDQELSCDDAVMQNETLFNRQEYAKAILTSNISTTVFNMQTSFGKGANTKMIKERISNIQTSQSYSRKIAWCSLIALTLVAAVQLRAQTTDHEKEVFEKLMPLKTPIVRIEPTYPTDAKQQGIEGWVVVEFGIKNNGVVNNINIISSYPEGIFDNAAKQAVAQWRFAPHDVQGAVGTKKLTFTL